ncbi:MAG: NAD(P)-dependent oxidoreductase [Rhodospirillales bacterium]|nr:NAD(P)-dependent oxidoreductase [Rhodospirillales bacterium]MCW9039598.1 NAD(P)-dependent oxidoreductase [Rhodospirillales bacterium]
MAKPAKIAFIGIGHMGHGIAKNLLKGGHDLTFLHHPGNRPTTDLEGMGATNADSIAGTIEGADVVFICVTGSPEVEAVVFGDDGLMESLKPGTLVIDCSTAMPDSTIKVATAVAEKGGRYVDAPMTRTPKEAEEGRLNVMVGGDADAVAAARPLIECYAENIYEAGPASAGHRLKLLHNYVSLGNAALLAEAVCCAGKGGVDLGTLLEVLRTGGGDSVALKRLSPYVMERDDTAMLFSIANAAKDIDYYLDMAARLDVPSSIASATGATFTLARDEGRGGDPVPRLVDAMGERHNAKVHPEKS